jgi:hypothetical protein
MITTFLIGITVLILSTLIIVESLDPFCKDTGIMPFRDLLKYHMKNNPYSGYVTLATIENNKPRARTVLFQGLVERGDKLGIAIKTSATSRKIVNADNEEVEIVWWMENTSVQFRFSGPVLYNHPDYEDERAKIWNSLNPAARSQFFYQGGLDASSGGPKFAAQDAAATRAAMASPPTSFAVGILFPNEVDFLNLGNLERKLWKNDGGAEAQKWTETAGFAPPVVSTNA